MKIQTKKKVLYFFGAILMAAVAVSVAGCGDSTQPQDLSSSIAQKTAYQKITAEEAKKIMDSDPNVILLDVRTPEEFAKKHIKGALQIADTEIAQRVETEIPDKEGLVLVYCRSGRRSAAAAKAMAEMGYTNVKDFGGIIDWPYDVVTE